jgi:hypothetical protein
VKISIHKKKVVTISEKSVRCKLETDGRMIERIMEHNYIGVNITSSRNLLKEIKIQAQIVARVAKCLNYLVWRKKYMRKETK